MSVNRIQKLLFSEYCEFEDMVLLESPFAQTLRDGKGIRQVHLGLTPSKLILATDVLPSAKESSVIFQGLDPEIETFELIAVYPVESVNLSIFHRRRRQSIKARFCNNRVLYFELGGFEKRNMFWNLWCERIKFLNPDDPGSSNSETSVATSTSNSTLYLVNAKTGLSANGKPQLWCQFDTKRYGRPGPWNDKNLYMGKGFEDDTVFHDIKPTPMSVSDFISHKKKAKSRRPKRSITNEPNATIRRTNSGVIYSVNRFGQGVNEKCVSSLFLPAENLLTSTEISSLYPLPPSLIMNFEEAAENSVRLWELAVEGTCNGRSRHRRRYAFSPQPYFLHGLGPWSVSPGENFSLQIKRAVSAVGIRRQSIEPELRLPVSRRYLLASISTEDLHVDSSRKSTNCSILKSRSPIIYFWTPKYWYHPRSAKDAYEELQKHLNNLQVYHQAVDERSRKNRLRNKLFRKKFSPKNVLINESSTESLRTTQTTAPTSSFMDPRAMLACFCLPREVLSQDEAEEETSLQYLRRILRLDVVLTAWDFNSATLAQQLTLIDRDLFLKINAMELGVLLWNSSSKNAPNIGAVIAFSHRISCLIATEILRDNSEKIRARLITRFINMADKCNKMSNFHSCKTVISGLQSPAVYRLHSTWNYVRKKHATKYQIFENLCKLHRDPRMPVYQEMFRIASKNPPCLPYIGDILFKLLDKVPKITRATNLQTAYVFKEKPKNKKSDIVTPSKSKTILRKLFHKLKFTTSTSTNVSKSSMTKTESVEKICTETVIHDAEVIFNETVSKEMDFTRPFVKYEDNRVKRLVEAVEMLEKFQMSVAQYTFTRNELAREYLLKARYREEKENFVGSFAIEIKTKL